MKDAVRLMTVAALLGGCTAAPELPTLTLEQAQALLPGETLSVQVLAPPARYAAAGLAMEAAGRIEIVPVAPEDARRICNGAGACSYRGLVRCRITISTEYTGDFRAALIAHERAHCAGWPASHAA